MDTLRAWERRYNAVTPARTERGRLYDERAIRRLLLLKSAVESGRSIGNVASLPDAQLEELERNAQSLGAKAEIPLAPESATLVLRPLLDAIGDYDCAAVNDEFAGEISNLNGEISDLSGYDSDMGADEELLGL